MAFENNKPTIRNYGVDGMREISQRRAATIANMVDSAKSHGLDEGFAREAIGKYGRDNAEGMRSSMKNPDDFKEFASLFGSDHNRDIYEMETVEKTDDKLEIHFHYCPYVEEWKKQGRSPEEIARLCDITMEGDHEFAKAFPCLSFKLDGTIADGKNVCRLLFTRKK
ncbi:L-2-amino-thiazoline-4-carboxylic acid hydrolase [Treponema sp.]|uniref:L-2-amino-thiazoline-4-carboxylic acid hydrolase n=1 Tax=Treponema sp. TaxID=166 RepID=UPI0025D0EE5D|nr:L-2-amino-thiazoline-4-carboxylic acid hydrolase [Treponema sp.]MCR5217902.1 L-2-amino-thiazoline-4-carboxylic acid hydrolase [Treponema sp.]